MLIVFYLGLSPTLSPGLLVTAFWVLCLLADFQYMRKCLYWSQFELILQVKFQGTMCQVPQRAGVWWILSSAHNNPNSRSYGKPQLPERQLFTFGI